MQGGVQEVRPRSDRAMECSGKTDPRRSENRVVIRAATSALLIPRRYLDCCEAGAGSV